MIEELQRTGRFKKAGFYQYEEGTAPQFWTELGDHYPLSKKSFQATEIIERLLFAQVIEAVWCLQENVIRSIPEANLGSIFGWGFPAFKGGVIQYIHDYGVDNFVRRCNQFKKKHGQRFSTPKKLRELVAKDQLNQQVL